MLKIGSVCVSGGGGGQTVQIGSCEAEKGFQHSEESSASLVKRWTEGFPIKHDGSFISMIGVTACVFCLI